MGEPTVTEIWPFCVSAFECTKIDLRLKWVPNASVNYSVLFVKHQVNLEVVSLHDHPSSVVWKATGLTPGVLNVVIIEQDDHGSYNISSVHLVSVLPKAAAVEMMEVFKRTEDYSMETSPCLPSINTSSTLTPHNLTTTPSSPPPSPHTDHLDVSVNSIAATTADVVRQFIWKDQVQPFTMDLEFLLTELEENGDSSGLLDVMRNISVFLIEVDAKETLRFVLETCADYNIQYSWGPLSISTEDGVNRLYEMVKFQQPNEQDDNSNEYYSTERVDLNNNTTELSDSECFSGNYESELQQQQQQQQYEEEEVDNHICQFGFSGARSVRLESSGDLTNDPQMLLENEHVSWRPVQFSAAPTGVTSFANCAISPALDQSSSILEGHDDNSPVQRCTIPQAEAVEGGGGVVKISNEIEVGSNGDSSDSIEKHSEQDFSPAVCESYIAVQDNVGLGETMVTVDVGYYSVIGILLPTLVVSWWLSFKAAVSLFENYQVSGVLLGFISTVLVLFILKKLAPTSYLPKLDSITRFISILVLIGCRVSFFTQHCHLGEISRTICFVQTLQAILWLCVLLKTRFRISVHFQVCLFFIDIVMFFIIDHYSNNSYCSNGICFTVFITNLLGEVFSFLLASIDGQKLKDHSTKKLS
eukprot:g5544.t1